jgi:Mn-dependent DtxR family transcriptional regulator
VPQVLEVGSDRSPARAREDYVKVIYQLGDVEPVKAADVARYLGVSPVSVSKAKRVLERDGYLEKSTPTDRLRLTRRGRKLAVSMVRRHRLLETFLHRSLDIPLELVHAEAERIEHTISEDIALRLAQLLGHPARDPHVKLARFRGGLGIRHQAACPIRRSYSIGEIEPIEVCRRRGLYQPSMNSKTASVASR